MTDSQLKTLWEDTVTRLGLSAIIMDKKENNEKVLEVDFGDLDAPDTTVNLIDEYMYNPAEMLAMGKTVTGLDIRVNNIPAEHTISICEVGGEHYAQLLSLTGVALRVMDKYSEIDVGAYKCLRCWEVTHFKQDYKNYREHPLECEYCKRPSTTTSFELLIKETEWRNVQYITLEESPETIDPMAQPKKIKCRITGDQCDIVQPGERITVNGILMPLLEKSGASKYYMLVNSLSQLDKEAVAEVDDKQREEIEKLAKDDGYLKLLSSRIAPQIYGHSEEKEALALSIAGGNRKRTDGGSWIRGDIHVLFVGDPGTAKTEMIEIATRFAPRYINASGGTSTEAGLTAVAKQEPNWYIESGALPKASGGVCTIDEYASLSKDQQKTLNSALEKQKIDVNKAGLTTTLQCRTTVWAAANPKKGRWQRGKTITKQIEIETSNLTRYDLIFVIKDKPKNQDENRMIYKEMNRDASDTIIDTEKLDELIKQWFKMAREITPKWTDDASKAGEDYFNSLRIQSTDDTTSCNVRVGRTINRLAEASAKLRLSKRVQVSDVRVAERVINYCLNNLIRDEEGNLDYGIIDTNETQTNLKKENRIRMYIKDHDGDTDYGYKIDNETMSKDLDIPGAIIEENIENLIRAGDLYTPKNGYLRVSH